MEVVQVSRGPAYRGRKKRVRGFGKGSWKNDAELVLILTVWSFVRASMPLQNFGIRGDQRREPD